MMNPIVAKSHGHDEARSFATLQVDMIADLVCPWCYLGKRRLDDALLAVRGPSVVSWFPFLLNPQMPAEGMGFEEYLESRFGELNALQPALADLTTTGQAEGIDFRFDRLSRVPNTLDAHRLLKLAETEGASVPDIAGDIFKGFFENGHDISDRSVLIDIGGKSGLSPRSIEKTLDDDATRQVVLAQEAQVRQGGVTSVPDFLINKRLFVMGAQSTENLVNVFDRAMFGEDSDQPVSPVVH